MTLLQSQGALLEPQAVVPTGGMLPFGGSAAPDGWLICDGASLDTTAYAALFAVFSYTYGGAGASFNLPDLRTRVPVGAQAGGDYDLGDIGGSATHVLVEAELPSHTHAVGTLVNGNQSASHTHGPGTLGTGNNSVGHSHLMKNHTHNMAHTHSVANSVSDNTAGGASERFRTGTGVNSGASSATNTGAPNDNTSNTQSANHTHSVTTGVSANQSASHSHTITGATAGTGSGTAHENRQPFLALNYIVKT